MPAIFISYRRSDSQDVTGRIYDRLVGKFTQQQVFKDVDNIPLGVSFPMHLKQMLRKTSVVLVIIGPTWLRVTDVQARRRLDDPSDFVRVEVETALRAGIPVVPVLISNTPMPPASELPRSLQALVSRNGTVVRPDPDFNNDVGRLLSGIEKLQKLLGASSRKPAKDNIVTDVEAVPVGPPIAIAREDERRLQAKSREEVNAPLPKRPGGAWSGRPRLLLWLGLSMMLICVAASIVVALGWIVSWPTGRGMEYVLVPKGTGWLGGGGGTVGEKPVNISYELYLAKYPVTQGEWEDIMGDNPSYFSRNGRGKQDVAGIVDADLKQFPVENVSWDDTQQFIEKLNAREKNSGWVYRLPTEAEWEYACRGGPIPKEESACYFYFDRPTNDLSSSQANIVDHGAWLGRTTKVGSYRSNRLGLYDMHGNVWQWCENPRDSGRSIRGGSFSGHDVYCQAAFQTSNSPAHRASNYGFRLARVRSGR